MGQVYTVPLSGYYLLEVWGAQGGSAIGNVNNRTPDNKPISRATGGLGGYTKGKIKLEANQILYVYVGGQGQNYEGSSTAQIKGGYNGGGSSMGCNSDGGGAGGGGSTHISTKNELLHSLSLSDVLIVSGGGGGAWACYAYYWSDARGMSDGGQGGGQIGGRAGYNGTIGYTSSASCSNILNQCHTDQRSFNYATGGTQSSGGIQGNPKGGTTCFGTYSEAKFGKGADASNGCSHSGGGGGSGLYGGGAGTSGHNWFGTGGAGGSSYTIPTMFETSMMQGVREGNGKAVISPISVNLNVCQSLANCRNYIPTRLHTVILVFISIS